MRSHMSHRKFTAAPGPRRQRGAVLVLIAIGLLAIIAMAGLALDGGHMMLNKTRLQNTVDAAALSAAKTLDQSGDTTQATAAALAAFSGNADASDNRELKAAYADGSGDIQVTVQYSETVRPFTPGAPAGPYVRVIATDFTMPAWLITVLGINEKEVAASAVAGPSPTINSACNIAPMMVCGDPAAGAENLWGYTVNAPDVLKTASGGNWGETPGPGNFQLIRLNDGQGAADLRVNMAGSYDACIESDEEVIETEPGNTVGPVAQGLNTRFGQYAGPMGGTEDIYPPDVIVEGQDPPLTTVENAATGEDDIFSGTTEVTAANINDVAYSYQHYINDMANPAAYDYQPVEAGGIGAFERRVVALPIGDCTTTTNGQGDVPLLGFACYFLLQPVVQQGTEAFVYGQFIEGCTVNGTPGPNPGSGPNPYIIQLYDDPDSADS